MANVNLRYTLTFEDAKSERFALPLYVTVVDTTTLATAETAMATMAGLVEAISDAELVKMALSLVSAGLPGGIKAAPVSGSDNEETGLLTFERVYPAGKAFGIDIPALAQAALLANQRDIDLDDSDVAAFIAAASASLLTSDWSSGLDVVRTARKTFRKHRRAAARG